MTFHISTEINAIAVAMDARTNAKPRLTNLTDWLTNTPAYALTAYTWTETSTDIITNFDKIRFSPRSTRKAERSDERDSQTLQPSKTVGLHTYRGISKRNYTRPRSSESDSAGLRHIHSFDHSVFPQWLEYQRLERGTDSSRFNESSRKAATARSSLCYKCMWERERQRGAQFT